MAARWMRGRLVVGALGAGCAAVLAAVTASAAAAGTPITADQLHLDASAPAQFTCIETGPQTTSGCGEGTPETGSATLAISVAADGGGVVTVTFLSNPRVTIPFKPFSAVSDGAGGVQLTAPATPGTVAFSALTLTGTATNFAGTMTFVNNSAHVNGTVQLRLALAGTGLTVVSPPSPTASPSASPSARAVTGVGAPVGGNGGIPPVVIVVVGGVVVAGAGGAAWVVRSQVRGAGGAGGTGGLAPSGSDPVGSLVTLQPSIAQVIAELNATGSTSLGVLAQQLAGVQGQISLLGGGGSAGAGASAVAGLQAALGGVQVPPPGYAVGVNPAAEAQALVHAQEVLDALVQSVYQFQQPATGAGGSGAQGSSTSLDQQQAEFASQQQQATTQSEQSQATDASTSTVTDEVNPGG